MSDPNDPPDPFLHVIDRGDRSLSAYYYSFESTGSPDVDRVLAAVAAAGKGFHNTSEWQSDLRDFGHDFPEYVDYITVIQEFASRAAKAFADLEAKIDQIIGDAGRDMETDHRVIAEQSDEITSMRAALELPLLFHRGGVWSDENAARWLEITGIEEATTKVMCDHIRSTLKPTEA